MTFKLKLIYIFCVYLKTYIFFEIENPEIFIYNVLLSSNQIDIFFWKNIVDVKIFIDYFNQFVSQILIEKDYHSKNMKKRVIFVYFHSIVFCFTHLLIIFIIFKLFLHILSNLFIFSLSRKLHIIRNIVDWSSFIIFVCFFRNEENCEIRTCMHTLNIKRVE